MRTGFPGLLRFMTKENNLTTPAAAPHVISDIEYYRLREMLFREFPEDLDELNKRCNATGTGKTDPDNIWKHSGDKPLFTNMSVKAGRRSETAWHMGLFPTWQAMGSANWDIQYRKGKNARTTDNFEINGELAKAFVAKLGKFTTLPDGTRFKRPRTARFRLYAMHSLAKCLVRQAAETGKPAIDLSKLGESLGPKADIETVAATCRALASEFGLGWGVTTVLHAMMDCGFWVVKPDVHLVKTVAKLGCLQDPTLALADSEKFLKKEACLFEVVGVARELATRIKPLPEAQGNAIREVDVVLMRANYRGLLEKFRSPPGQQAA
jgi:hypothetical protein